MSLTTSSPANSASSWPRLVLASAASVALGACSQPPNEIADPAPDMPYPEEILCPDEIIPDSDAAPAKNIILIIGDGMGPLQVEAGRIANGGPLAWDALDGPIYFNTDSLTTDRSDDPDSAPTDSAAAATAMATGVRVLNGSLSTAEDGRHLDTVLETARAQGKAVGLVTTSYLYDASPMAFAVHVEARGMYSAVVDQLLTVRPEVVMGGALSFFSDNDGAYAAMAEAAGYHLVYDASELAAWDPAAHPALLGLFQSSYDSLAPNLYQWGTTPVAARDQTSTDPLLADMVGRALDRLGRDSEGFFLFVENETIDSLGHISIVERDLARTGMPEEVVALSNAVQVVLDWVVVNSSFDETLVVITADHECGSYVLNGVDLDDGKFLSLQHTRTPVALWAAGPGSKRIDSICRGSDVYHLLTGQLPADRPKLAIANSSRR
ncbi:MAG: alkaline phosphatase [Proteobacteria bacterium]|nr:alkaline phosphatase [Pseudomonadota bacterium]